MVDAAQNSQPTGLKRPTCKVYPNITHEQLLELLSAINGSFSFRSPLQSVKTQQDQNQINPYFFDNSFAPTKNEFYYVDPFLAEADETTDPYVLSREDVIQLFESIEELISKGELGLETALQPQHLDLLRRIKNGLPNNKEQLEADIPLFIETIALMQTGEEQEEAAGGIEVGIPARLKELIDRPFDLKESWQIVKQLAQDANRTPFGQEAISTSIEGNPVVLQVIHFRFFINDWLKKLYSDDFKYILESKRMVLPAMQSFAATNKFFAYIDQPDWNELDKPVTEFLLGPLSDFIDEFLKAEEYVPPTYAQESTESSEGENTVTEKKTVSELEELMERFSQANASYTQETERLTTILLPQFFSMHKMTNDLIELEQVDSADFRLIEREFRSELFNVLRSLTPEEFALLKERGASLEFRLIVLRKLYGKLSTNPKFIGSIERFKESYVEHLEKRIADGKVPQGELNNFNERINLDDEAFDRKLKEEDKKEQARAGDWTESVSLLADFSQIQSLTQEDLRTFLGVLSKGQITDEAFYDTLLRNLDVVIAERWSPEQIRGLSPASLHAVFGIDLPDSIASDPTRMGLFLQLCAEYLYARRKRLAEHYELDAITREGSTSGDLASLQAAQETAEKYKDAGGGEGLVVARASDEDRVSEYVQGGHRLASTISAIHQDTKKQRKEKLEQEITERKNRFATTTSIAAKREFLEELGLLSPQVDEVRGTDAEHLAYLQGLFDSTVEQDYADGLAALEQLSYFEDDDGGYVQEGGQEVGQRGVPMRYGRPGGRSLMKGALNIRNKFKTAQKRIKQLKEIRKKAKQGKKTVDATVKTVKEVAKTKDRVKKGLFVVALASLIDTINLMTHSLGAAIGGVIGGGVGIFLTWGGGPLTISIGGLTGAWVGARTGYAIENGIKDFLGIGGGTKTLPQMSYQGPSLGNLGGAAAAKTTVDSTISLTGGATAKGGAWAGFGSVTGVTGYFVGATMVVFTTVIASIQPPPLSTIGSGGLESPYITIEKVSVEGENFEGPVPGQITYRISVQARDDYQIEIINFQDQFTITTNQELNTGTPPALSCDSQMNMDTVQTKVITPADGKVLLGTCTVNLNESYHDSSIFNKITLQFRVTQNGEVLTNESPDPSCGENENTFCGISGQLICLGECPAQEEGCWPVTGTLTQPPYGTFSHSVVDAFDISAPLGREEYATFDGTAWAFDTFSGEPSEQGIIVNGKSPKIYGKHVLLVTNQGFVLLYGHMSRHGPTLQLGQPVQVTAGTILGYVGNSGSTDAFPMGNHLHYEYRVSTGNSWHSVIPGKPRDPLSSIVPGDTPGQAFVYSEGKQVVTCYTPNQGQAN